MIAFILDLYVTQIATREKGSVRTFENDRIGYEDIDVDSNNNQYSMQGLTKQENHWEILEERKTSFVGENKNRGNQYVQLSPAYKSKSEDGSESIPK